MAKQGKVRVAVVGVGNCACALVQGVHFYRNAPSDSFVPGLMHVDLGGYHVSDIEFTAAFDVDASKVGIDLSEAIWQPPNNTIKFADVPKMNVPVSRGMTHDGVGKYLSGIITKATGPTADIQSILKADQAKQLFVRSLVGSHRRQIDLVQTACNPNRFDLV